MLDQRASEMPAEKPDLRLVYFPHGEFPTDAEKFMRLLSDREVLFVEAVSETQTLAERMGKEEMLNIFLAEHPEFGETERQDHEALLVRLGQSPNVVNQIVARLAGSGKKIILVDIGPWDDCFWMLAVCRDLHRDIQFFILMGMVEEAEQAHRRHTGMVAHLHAAREEVVGAQVGEHLRKLGAVRAAVLQGLVHQPAAELYSANGEQNVETVVWEDELKHEAKLWLRVRKGEEIADADFRRAFLSAYMIRTPEDDLEAIREIDNRVAALSDTQVDELISDFERVYAETLLRLSGGRKLSADDELQFGAYIVPEVREQLWRKFAIWTIEA